MRRNQTIHSRQAAVNRRSFLSQVSGGMAGAALAGSWLAGLPRSAFATEGTLFGNVRVATSTGGVCACINFLASDIGASILKQGGNAIDAAIAMVYALGVTRPEMCGIGGSGMLLYRGGDNHAAALDFQGQTGAAFPEDALEGPGMHNDPTVFFGTENSGHRVVGIPGVVAATAMALDELGSGKFTLAELIAPAERLAREGFEIGDELAAFIFLEKQRLMYYTETARTFLPWDIGFRGDVTGTGLQSFVGTFIPRFKLIQTDYARSLRMIMDQGPAVFYTGEIADRLAEDMANAEFNASINPVLLANAAKWGGFSADKGFIDKADLAAYQPKWREPLETTFRGHQVLAMPPSGSGAMVLEMLNILEKFDLAGMGHFSADFLHAMAETHKLGRADQVAYLADPDVHPEVHDLAAMMASKDYAKRRFEQIDMQRAQRFSEGITPQLAHTNHLSVIDRFGNAVGLTSTQGWPFGSVVMVPGTGIVLNDQIGDWIRTPGIDRPLASTRPRTNMSPTIFSRGGEPVLVTGAAGGSRIPGGIVQVIINVMEMGMDLPHAVDAERMDAANFTPADPVKYVSALAVESGGNRPLPADVIAELERRGHEVQQLAEYGYSPPIVESVGVDAATGLNIAATDPRGEGGAGGE